MDEASIQTLRADLIEDYHILVRSHTAAIEQLLEDFNDDQMMFRLEAEAYEQERLAAIQTSPPTPREQNGEPSNKATTEQNDRPSNEDTTNARQEGPALTERPPEPTNTPPTVPDPVAIEDRSLRDTQPPTSTVQTQSPTPQLEQPTHTPDPETILDILEEE